MQNSPIDAHVSVRSLTLRSSSGSAAFEANVHNNSDRFANFHIELSAPGENLNSEYKWYRISPEVAAAQPPGSTTTFQVIVFQSPVPGFVGTLDLTVRVFSPQLRQERRLTIRLTIESQQKSFVNIELPIAQFQVYPRNTVEIPVRVKNLGQQFVEVVLQLTGIDPAWLPKGNRQRVSLPANSQTEIAFACQPPSITQALSQEYPFSIEAVGFELPSTNRGNIEILPFGSIWLEIEPKHQVLGRQAAQFKLSLKNSSNLQQQANVLLQGKDRHRCSVEISPAPAELNLGQTALVQLAIAHPRPWLGIGRELHLEAKPILSDERLGTTDPATQLLTVRVLPRLPLWAQLSLLALTAGSLLWLFKPARIAHSAFVNSVRFSGDGATVLSGSDDCTIRRWRRDGDRLEPFQRSVAASTAPACGAARATQGLLGVPNSSVSVLRLMPEDSNRLAVGLENGAVELWNVTNATQSGQIEPPTNDRVFDLVFSQNSQSLFAGYGSGRLRWWERQSQDGKFQARTDRPIDLPERLKLNFQIRALALSPDGHTLAIGGNYKSFVVWEKPTGREAATNPRLAVQKLEKLYDKLSAGDGDYIWGMAFAPSAAQILVTADSAGYITVWDLARCLPDGKAQNIQELNCQQSGVIDRWQGSPQSIRSVVFSEDGKLLVSGGDDGRLMAWWLTSDYRRDPAKTPTGRELYRSERKINTIDLKTVDGGIAIVTGSEDFQVELHQIEK